MTDLQEKVTVSRAERGASTEKVSQRMKPDNRVSLGGIGRRIGHFAGAMAAPVLLVVVWELYVRIADVNPIVLPAPSVIVSHLYDVRELAWGHTKATLLETAFGFSASVLVALVVSILLDQSRWLRRTLYPMLVASQTIPIIAIAPLMIIWFGFGMSSKVLVIILVTFFPILVALLDGFASTEVESTNLLRTMGARNWQIFRYVRFPTALPFFFTGLRISVTYAVVAAIFAEYVGAYKGLGIWIQISKNTFRTDLVFGAILIVSVLSVLLFLGIYILSRVMMPWYYQARSAKK